MRAIAAAAKPRTSCLSLPGVSARRALASAPAAARAHARAPGSWLACGALLAGGTLAQTLAHQRDGVSKTCAEPTSTAPGEGRVALITGSSSGIGRAFAERLASEGYRVVVNSCNSREAGEALARTLPGAVYVQADCSTREGCELVVREAVRHCGRLDVLVCNAGIGKVIPHNQLDLIDDDYLHKTFALNCFGPLWLSRAAMPHLQASGDGCIVMTSSVAGSRPMGSSVPYSMARAAMNHLTKLLAKNFGPQVRVNAVAPGLVDTNITSGPEWEAARAAVSKMLPMRRVGMPEDMTEALMCCLRSSYMTGQVINVDGGSTIMF